MSNHPSNNFSNTTRKVIQELRDNIYKDDPYYNAAEIYEQMVREDEDEKKKREQIKLKYLPKPKKKR